MSGMGSRRRSNVEPNGSNHHQAHRRFQARRHVRLRILGLHRKRRWRLLPPPCDDPGEEGINHRASKLAAGRSRRKIDKISLSDPVRRHNGRSEFNSTSLLTKPASNELTLKPSFESDCSSQFPFGLRSVATVYGGRSEFNSTSLLTKFGLNELALNRSTRIAVHNSYSDSEVWPMSTRWHCPDSNPIWIESRTSTTTRFRTRKNSYQDPLRAQ